MWIYFHELVLCLECILKFYAVKLKVKDKWNSEDVVGRYKVPIFQEEIKAAPRFATANYVIPIISQREDHHWTFEGNR